MIIDSTLIDHITEIARRRNLREVTISHDGASITIVLQPRPSIAQRALAALHRLRASASPRDTPRN